MNAEEVRGRVRIAVVLLALGLFCLIAVRTWRPAGQDSRAYPDLIAVEVKGDVPQPGVYLLEPAKASVTGTLAWAGFAGQHRFPDLKLRSGESLKVIAGVPFSTIVSGSMSARARLACGLRLDVNSASETELMLIPQMRPDVAASIMKRRDEKRFMDLRELLEINGIGPKTAQRLQLFLEINS